MIYVTGDIHGDRSRFKSKEFRKLKRKDTLIVCGDFGFLWDGSVQEEKILKWIGKRPYQVLFVEGANDNLQLLQKYPITEWNGGKVREISGKLKHLVRGSVFTIEDQKIFAFGGGENTDIATMEQHEEWWGLQMPSQKELEQARENLEEVNWQVDHIVTHQASRKLRKLLTMEDNEANVLDFFFDEVREKCEYIGWYFGNHHINRVIPPSEVAIFDKVIPLLKGFELDIFNSKKKIQKSS